MAKILAIDDRVDNLTTLSALLRAMIPGCMVLCAQSGKEGIEKAKAESPDTILLDIRMPEMDGFEVCRRLKADSSTRAIPIIIVTAVNTDSESRIKGLNTGADAFLSKPVDPGELAAQVRAMLRIKKAEDDLRRQRDELNHLVDERTRELRITERDYRVLFNSTNDAIFIQSLDGRFLEVNHEACRRLGYEREELLGLAPADLDGPEYAALASARMEEILRNGQAIYTTAHVTRTGRVIPTEISCKLIEYEGKSYFLNVARDITERVKAEKEKIKLETQLRQAQKMEAIGTLAGGIAHDFNNILAAILGYTELAIANLPEGSSLSEDLSNVLQAGKRARDLVLQILTFSRQSESESRPVQMQLIVREVVRLLQASLPSTISILQKIDTGSGTVKADPTKIHQLLMNLCTNAFHALRDTGGILEISLDSFHVNADIAASDASLKEGEYVRLKVRDTGHGMDESTMERIFDPFFTTKVRGEGTGMGLAVAHGIVAGCGGAIHVASALGAGSTFTVYLPRSSDEGQERAEKTERVVGGTESILLVDDEPTLAELNEEVLGRLGYKVTATTSSVDALSIFLEDSSSFDLVITDLTMPRLTGLQLAKKMLEFRRDIPIILCTGFTETVTPEMVKACGIRELLLKPIIQQDLGKAVRRVLDKA